MNPRTASHPAIRFLPVLLLVPFLLLVPGAARADWWSGFGQAAPSQGLNAPAYDLVVHNGELVAGGLFLSAGQGTGTSRIARWNGSRWRQIAGGMDDAVTALHVQGNTLWAGGSFIHAGWLLVGRVATWTPGNPTWDDPGGGVSGGIVLEIAGYQGDVVVGGAFTEAGGNPAVGVARWDGSAWSGFGSGIAGDVWALAEYDGDLYAGGDFLDAGGTPVTYLARWDGTAWSAPATIVEGPSAGGSAVTVMTTEYGGDLVVAGGMSHIDGVYVNSIASWDGSAWTPLGLGLSDDPTILAVTVYEGDLIAHGRFSVDGGTSFDVARWDGSQWSALGPGTLPCDLFYDSQAGAAVYDGDLYVAGDICTAGSESSLNIARWNDAATDVPEVAAVPSHLTVSGRNPFREATEISYALDRPGPALLSVYDAAGRLVKRLAFGVHGSGPHVATWSGRDARDRPVAAGVYFVRLTTPDLDEKVKVVRLR